MDATEYDLVNILREHMTSVSDKSKSALLLRITLRLFPISSSALDEFIPPLSHLMLLRALLLAHTHLHFSTLGTKLEIQGKLKIFERFDVAAHVRRGIKSSEALMTADMVSLAISASKSSADWNHLAFQIVNASTQAISSYESSFLFEYSVRFANDTANFPKDTLRSFSHSSRIRANKHEKRREAFDLFWSNIEADMRTSNSENSLKSVLWPTSQPNWWFEADHNTRAIWAKDPATWAFWEKWWDGVISGKMPFAPDLLRDVALIDDDIWQAGPREVAQAIARIEQIHDLRAQLAALTKAMDEEDLPQFGRSATLAHRGHNNPPELIEAMAIVQASAVHIVQALDDARVELAKPAPEPSRLKAIGTWMLSVVMKAAGYCGGLVDKSLQEFAGEMGKQAAKWFMILLGSRELVSMLTAFAKNLQIWPF